MFYCESCREAKGWPESFGRSRGPCEVCGKVRDCHDVATKSLPEPRQDP